MRMLCGEPPISRLETKRGSSTQLRLPTCIFYRRSMAGRSEELLDKMSFDRLSVFRLITRVSALCFSVKAGNWKKTLLLGLGGGEAGGGQDAFIEGYEEAFAAGQDGAVGALEFCLVEDFAVG